MKATQSSSSDFSRAGSLSDPNGKMDHAARLAVWTSIGVNYDVYQPGYQQILERYLLKFSKGGADIGLLDEGGDGDDGEGEYYIQQ